MSQLGDHIIWDDDGANPIYFIGDLGRPWPENPEITFDRAVTIKRCIPGWDTGTSLPTPGRRIVFDAGYHLWTCGDIEITLPYVTDSNHDLLFAMSQVATPFRWSPDAGLNVWRVAWQSGKSYEPSPEAGNTEILANFPTIYFRKAKIKLHILSKVV